MQTAHSYSTVLWGFVRRGCGVEKGYRVTIHPDPQTSSFNAKHTLTTLEHLGVPSVPEESLP